MVLIKFLMLLGITTFKNIQILLAFKDFNNLIEDETKSYSERIELFLDAYFKITRKNIKLYPYIQHLNQIEKNLIKLVQKL